MMLLFIAAFFALLAWTGLIIYLSPKITALFTTPETKTNVSLNVSDPFVKMWDQQVDFMKLLQTRRSFPKFPVDMKSKEGQRLIKDIGHDLMHEVFESLHLLKNSKNHRKTEITEFDRNEFIEEVVDANKFLLEMLILAGVSKEEYTNMFFQKGETNVKRIKGDY